MSIKFKFAKLA